MRPSDDSTCFDQLKPDYRMKVCGMDGKSRRADNIMIERWFRSFKYEEAYLTQYNNIREARQAIRSYVKKYNFERCHSAIGGVPPAQAYFPAMLLDAARATA